jgi:quercetin dioxygenase-like cupin family protein
MAQDKVIKILRIESLPSNPGPAEYFTGSVRITPLAQGEEPSCMTCGCVTFEPSARSAWHTHPKGQLLIVTEGSGFIQEWGNSIQRIQQGDVIWTPPKVKHWHGGSLESSMTHIAIQETLNGKNIDWLEKVSDEQYNAGVAR